MHKKTIQRYEAIRKEFERLTKKKKMRSGAAIEELAKRFIFEESTIEAIVYQKGRYKIKQEPTTGQQLDIFDT